MADRIVTKVRVGGELFVIRKQVQYAVILCDAEAGEDDKDYEFLDIFDTLDLAGAYLTQTVREACAALTEQLEERYYELPD